jgi:hypothetical protein
MPADFSQHEVGAIPRIAPDTLLELVACDCSTTGTWCCPAGDHEHSLLVDPMDIVPFGSRARDPWTYARTSREGDGPPTSWMHDRQPRSCEPRVGR